MQKIFNSIWFIQNSFVYLSNNLKLILMKKLLLLVLLLFSLTVFSQQFAKETFTKCIYVNEYKEKSEWLDTNLTVIFYEELKVELILNNETITFNVTDAKQGKTEGGFTTYDLTLEEVSTKEILYLQVFDDETYGIRLCLPLSRQTIQYVKEVKQ